MLVRGPGANEPHMISERVKAGMSFDEAIAEVETLCNFRCEQWWIDLNRPLFTNPPPAQKAEPPKKGK
jgi:hypothetical protein